MSPSTSPIRSVLVSPKLLSQSLGSWQPAGVTMDTGAPSASTHQTPVPRAASLGWAVTRTQAVVPAHLG